MYEVGQIIDYKFVRTGGVSTGTIQYIDDEKVKISSPPPSGLNGAEIQQSRKHKHKNKGSWYWLDELEILSD